MIGVNLCLPDDVNISEMDWYDEPTAPLRRSYSQWASECKAELAEQGGPL